MALKIRRDDEVVVISGKDRGKKGRVLRVDPKKSKVFRPDDFNPHAKKRAVRRKADITVLKQVFVDRRRPR